MLKTLPLNVSLPQNSGKDMEMSPLAVTGNVQRACFWVRVLYFFYEFWQNELYLTRIFFYTAISSLCL